MTRLFVRKQAYKTRVMSTLSFCADQARRLDRDRFLCALFAPEERREALFALLAFNAEVARVRESVSEPLLGSVRLQWWRETIAAIYGGVPPAHMVATELAGAIRTYGLSRDYFERLLDAREFDLTDAVPEDLPALLAYAEATSAGLNMLFLEVLETGEGSRAAAEEAGRDVGIAWALAGLLRAVPFHAKAGRLYLPKSLLNREGVTKSDVFAGRAPSGLAAVVHEIVDVGRRHLARARGRERSAPGWARPALLPGVLASSYLSGIERVGYNPFLFRNERGGFRRQLRLWLASVGHI
jgi:phytoene synthase